MSQPNLILLHAVQQALSAFKVNGKHFKAGKPRPAVACGPKGHFVRYVGQPHEHIYYTFRVHVKVILSIRLEFLRFPSTRYFPNRNFTQTEVTIVTFIVTEVDETDKEIDNCNICGPL